VRLDCAPVSFPAQPLQQWRAEQPVADLGAGEGRQRERHGLYRGPQRWPGCPRALAEMAPLHASAPSIPQKPGLTALGTHRQQCTQRGVEARTHTYGRSSQATRRGPTGGTLQPCAAREGVQTLHPPPTAGKVFLALVHARSSKAIESWHGRRPGLKSSS